jgi:two-component system KDP operon response regulator KdpE
MSADRAHILVVDDEPQITRVLRTTLVARGYEIRVANDGEMALEIMKDWTPHLVITDLAMPNLDGIQLCRRVRTFSQVPIIVLSVRGKEQQKLRRKIEPDAANPRYLLTERWVGYRFEPGK